MRSPHSCSRITPRILALQYCALIFLSLKKHPIQGSSIMQGNSGEERMEKGKGTIQEEKRGKRGFTAKGESHVR